jgi:hypothetical protein
MSLVPSILLDCVFLGLGRMQPRHREIGLESGAFREYKIDESIDVKVKTTLYHSFLVSSIHILYSTFNTMPSLELHRCRTCEARATGREDFDIPRVSTKHVSRLCHCNPSAASPTSSQSIFGSSPEIHKRSAQLYYRYALHCVPD